MEPTSNKMNETCSTSIVWPCDFVVPSKRSENTLRSVLHRKGEWGRGRDLPPKRLEEITRAAQKQGMTLFQALSLRRSLLRSFNPARFNKSSAMGSSRGQQQVAGLFEEAVVSFLVSKIGKHRQTVFLTEAEQMAEMKAGKRPFGPTPDILFLKPVEINGCIIKWLDAKHYYASAMLADKKSIPNGRLKNQAARYKQHFGGIGAFVFARGYCRDLSLVLTDAILLDATPLDMSAVEAYQDAQAK